VDNYYKNQLLLKEGINIFTNMDLDFNDKRNVDNGEVPESFFFFFVFIF
jgi:hypothetical protein